MCSKQFFSLFFKNLQSSSCALSAQLFECLEYTPITYDAFCWLFKLYRQLFHRVWETSSSDGSWPVLADSVGSCLQNVPLASTGRCMVCSVFAARVTTPVAPAQAFLATQLLGADCACIVPHVHMHLWNGLWDRSREEGCCKSRWKL